ncbi:uncharacterized protein LOC143922040 [Arctopsyche grandis]|uniref:uncharacterized protein LOC143922040 n=1 Tax=Arctopsyche grandis TaxID=121162 RepID=UPI00406D6EDB
MFTKNINFPKAEEEVLKYWKDNDCFALSNEQSKERKPFIFYDGPPFATGLPHYGHILSGTIKDTIGRFWHQQGYYVKRRFGWDCHGLPVEYEIDKKLNITDRKQILEMGIAQYNEECKAIVMKYSSEWEVTVERMGRWVDFKNGYKTMDISFMESTWFMFKQLWERNKVYRGFKIMPFSTACKTPLSNFEANQNYKDVSDPSVLIAFPLLKHFKNLEISLIAWTTTPWTLPSNCALVVNDDFKYDIFLYKNKHYIMHTNRIAEYLKDYTIVGTCFGIDLVGLEYSQPFDFFENFRSKNFFRVISDSFVSDSNGSGIVHCAPAFGEEDYKVFVAKQLISQNDEVPCPVDENGCFTLGKYKGIYVKDLNKIILEDIKDRVLMNGRIVHSYPYCWRSDTPLIYKLVPSWFIKVKESHASLIKNNEKINWIPADIKYKRFHNWLAQSRDWAVSRSRFWGTPLPIWVTENYDDCICIGSIKELEELSGAKICDLHRQYIDDIVIEKDGKTYRRIDEVFDCWFESGVMPYAQDHWPFSLNGDISDLSKLNLKGTDGNLVKQGFPAQFIGEGLDQTRGWFYTLHVISSILFDQPAFENVIVNGIVLAEDGKKMSKRLKNYPDPNVVFSNYGADSLRLYLISSPVVEADNLRFNELGVKEILKVFLIPWYNSLSFLKDCEEGDSITEMDNWIQVSFDNLCFNITETTKNFKLAPVLSHALKFVDDLSNWYIRINRKALRNGSKLLRKLLSDFSVVMAPYAPFFSEYCYQSTRIESSALSVHFCSFPKTEKSEHPFDKAKTVIEAIRHMREKYKLKVKRPLKSATIVSNSETSSILKSFVDVIMSECNLLDLLFEEETQYEFITVTKPCFDSLKKDKDNMKAKIEVIRNLNDTQILEIINSPIVINSLSICKEDLLISKEFKGVEFANTFDNFGVILDVEMNESILEKADAREFYSFLQKLRKTSGLVVDDLVNVEVESEYLKKIVSVNYPDVIFGSEGVKVGESQHTLRDSVFLIRIFKLK